MARMLHKPASLKKLIKVAVEQAKELHRQVPGRDVGLELTLAVKGVYEWGDDDELQVGGTVEASGPVGSVPGVGASAGVAGEFASVLQRLESGEAAVMVKVWARDNENPQATNRPERGHVKAPRDPTTEDWI